MQTKHISPKKYFCFMGQTTLNKISAFASPEIDPLMEEAHKLGLEPSGPLEFIYFDATDDKDKPFTLWIALPVKNEIPVSNSKYSFKTTDDFKCFSHIHKGDISQVYQVYDKIFAELFSKGVKPTNQIREVYENWESVVSPENITEIQIGIM